MGKSFDLHLKAEIAVELRWFWQELEDFFEVAMARKPDVSFTMSVIAALDVSPFGMLLGRCVLVCHLDEVLVGIGAMENRSGKITMTFVNNLPVYHYETTHSNA